MAAFLLRVYRLDDLLGFYFDQGRDALVVKDFLVSHKFFLIGPTTGIEGIFLGPFYYLTLIPWYWLGRGSPVFPAVYIAGTTVLALWLMTKLSDEMFGRRTAYTFLVMGAFSYWLVVASRWLANPTQLMLASSIAVFGLWRILRGDDRFWVVVALALGASLQFEAAGAFFFLPAIVVFLIWQRKRLPGWKILTVSIGVFILTLAPQAMFDIRHGHLMFKSFFRFLVSEQSFRTSLAVVLGSRADFYWHALWSKIFARDIPLTRPLVAFVVLSILFIGRRLKSDGAKLLWIWLLTPLVGLLFYQGNHGYIWDYYLTGVYLVFLLLVAAVVSWWARNTAGRILFLAFMLVFAWTSLPLTRNYLVAGVDGPTNVVLGNERQSVLWVLNHAEAEGRPYNVDTYVPPVIPYAYDYLFSWLSGGPSEGPAPSASSAQSLYTIYEVDPPHPERLTNWLNRQRGIGKVEEVATFGGITVERRTRVK